MVLSAASHVGLALLVSFPMLRQPFHRLVGSPDVDVWNHAWGPWWWWDSLSQGQLPWRTLLLKWPVGGELWFIDPLLALVGAPLVPLLGPVGAYNGAMLLSLAFSSWAAGRLAGALGVKGGARFVASAVLVGAPTW